MKSGRLLNKYLFPLICAAAASRSEKHLRNILILAKKRGTSFLKLYEALLQNYLFAGYPSAILSLKILREFFPQADFNSENDMNLYHFKRRGEQICKKIYGNKYKKLLSNIREFSPDLSKWLVLEGYGKVLGRKGLPIKERELCIIAVLSVLKFSDQLYSHINGAIKIGVSLNEIKNTLLNLEKIGKRREAIFGSQVLKKYQKNKGIQ